MSQVPLPDGDAAQEAGSEAVMDVQAHYRSLIERERWYVWEGGIYAIRDVITPEGKFAGFCEYAARLMDGALMWKPCAEGVDFKDIEPLARLVNA